MTLNSSLKEDLKRLSRLAASLTDSHSCALFLPTGLLRAELRPANTAINFQSSPRNSLAKADQPNNGAPIELRRIIDTPEPANLQSIDLVTTHSVSSSLCRDCRIQIGNGLLGWVAQYGRPIHVSPFEGDSAALGIYAESVQLTSLAALPIPIPLETTDDQRSYGVLMCDTTRSLSFTKQQIKHLEDLTTEISRLLFWALCKKERASAGGSWGSFVARVEDLGAAIGNKSIEFLRLTSTSFSEIERVAGVSEAVRHSEQFLRLIEQTLPPHFPVIRLPQGDIIIALDNMMSGFFQNKIQTLIEQHGDRLTAFKVSIAAFSTSLDGNRLNIDAVLQTKNITSKQEPHKALGGIRA
jgi:hypothetical protein